MTTRREAIKYGDKYYCKALQKSSNSHEAMTQSLWENFVETLDDDDEVNE
jgi:hypothetical protein